MNRRKWFKKTATATAGAIFMPDVVVKVLAEPKVIPVLTLQKVDELLLTTPSLQRGVIEVLVNRGAKPLLESLPFKTFEGGTGFNFTECESCGFYCNCPIDESKYR